jgi:hypothetical protein
MASAGISGCGEFVEIAWVNFFDLCEKFEATVVLLLDRRDFLDETLFEISDYKDVLNTSLEEKLADLGTD